MRIQYSSENIGIKRRMSCFWNVWGKCQSGSAVIGLSKAIKIFFFSFFFFPVSADVPQTDSSHLFLTDNWEMEDGRVAQGSPKVSLKIFWKNWSDVIWFLSLKEPGSQRFDWKSGLSSYGTWNQMLPAGIAWTEGPCFSTHGKGSASHLNNLFLCNTVWVEVFENISKPQKLEFKCKITDNDMRSLQQRKIHTTHH